MVKGGYKPSHCPQHKKAATYAQQQRWKKANGKGGKFTEYHREYYRKHGEKNPKRKRETRRKSRQCKERKDRERETQRIWRQNHPEKVRAHRKRRHDRKRSTYVEDVDRSTLFVRDVGVCQLCGAPISDALLVLDWLEHHGRPHKESPSEDHIVPVSKGGEHSYKNVQLAHVVCNSTKRDK